MQGFEPAVRAWADLPDYTRRFYVELFQRAPSTRRLFSSDTSKQEHRVLTVLSTALDHIEDADWLTETLGELGRKYVALGVQAAYFAPFRDALVAAAEPAMSPEELRAWAESIDRIVGHVKAPLDTLAVGSPGQPET